MPLEIELSVSNSIFKRTKSILTTWLHLSDASSDKGSVRATNNSDPFLDVLDINAH